MTTRAKCKEQDCLHCAVPATESQEFIIQSSDISGLPQVPDLCGRFEGNVLRATCDGMRVKITSYREGAIIMLDDDSWGSTVQVNVPRNGNVKKFQWVVRNVTQALVGSYWRGRELERAKERVKP